jgi:hypothetical protein
MTLTYERVLRRQLEELELVVRQSPASKNVNKEAEEATALEAVTGRQTGKDTAGWEDLVRAVVNCRVCELALAV